MSGFKVGDSYRQNRLSFRPGGYTVIVEFHSGQRLEYDKVKYPDSYIKKLLSNPSVKRAYVK